MDIEADLNLKTDLKEAVSDIRKTSKEVEKLASSFSSVSKQVDDVIKHIENLAAVTANVRQTVNKTTNNSNSYKRFTSHRTTKVQSSEGKAAVAIGDVVYSGAEDSRTKAGKAASEALIRALQTQNSLLEEQLNKSKELTRLEKERANLTAERAKNFSKEAESRNLNAKAALKNAETRAAHPELFGVGANNRSFKFQTGKALQNIGHNLAPMGTGSRIAGDIMGIVGGFLKTPAIGFGAVLDTASKAVLDFAKAATKAYSEIESIKTQLGVVFSNQSQADAMFGNIAQYAVKSPFGVQQTSELAVLLKQSGVYASDLMSTLRMIGDTAGGNMEKMKRIANNYAQIVSIGKASMLDMRQFAYAGIPIFEAVSKELGVSQQRLRKLISDGKVTAEIVEKVFKDLTGVNGVFENATEKGAKTLKARLQNLADAKQLALSAMGEGLVNFKTQTGNDSYVNRIVATTEEIYQWLYNYVNTKNIQANVETIAKRDTKIKDLQTLIEYNKSIGNKELAKQLEAVLKQELAKSDPMKDLATLYASYQAKNSRLEEYRAGGETRDLATARADYRRISNRLWWAQQLENNRMGDMSDELVTERALAAGVTSDHLDLQIEALKIEEQALKSLIDALVLSEKTTEEERDAERRQYTFYTQSGFVDSTNKLSDSTKSLNASFQELAAIYEDSEQQKKKREEEHIQELKNAQKELKKLNQYTDKTGNVDITKMSAATFLSARNKGAFESSAIQLTGKGKDSDVTRNRNRITSNLEWAYNQALSNKEISTNISDDDKKKIEAWINQLKGSKTNADFFNLFNKYFKAFDKTIEKAVKVVEDTKTTEEEKEALRLYNDLAQAITSNYSIQNSGINANPLDFGGSNKNITTALWKRVLAQYTGLSASAITDTESAIKTYHEDVSARSLASGVFYEMFKNMDTATIQKMLAPSGGSALFEGDSKATLQINWNDVRKRIEEFSLSLSASTEVVDAYKRGLEAELDTYAKLASEGMTAMETGDSVKRIMGVKQYSKFLQNYKDQLVNPFGEELQTKEGQTVYAREVNGLIKYFDAKEGGNEVIVDELHISTNLVKQITAILPKLRQDIQKASAAQVKAQVTSSLLSSQMNTTLMGYQTYGQSAEARFVMNNPEQAQQLFNDQMDVSKAGTKYSGKTTNEILLAAKSGETEAVKLIQTVFDTIKSSVSDIVNSPEYKLLYADKLTNKSTSAAEEYVNNLGVKREYRDENLAPTDYSGWRGVRNRMADWWGVGKDFDKEDYLLASLTTKPETKSWYETRRENLARLYTQGGYDEVTETTFEGGMDPQAAAIQAKLDAQKELLEGMDEEEKKAAAIAYSQEEAAAAMTEMGNAMGKALADAGKAAYSAPFEALGESLVTGDDASKDLAANMKQIGASLLKNVGAAMTTAGFQIAGAAALSQNWGMVASGLALAAAGGVVSGIGGAVSKGNSEKDKNDDKLAKLEKLKQDLADLLKQAREDAIYYETTLRHKNAISANDEFKVQKVNDAIITPKGVVQTAPDDYLFATKNPQTLLGGGRGSPIINFSVIDKSTGIKVTEQRSTYDEERNQIDIEAVIESKVNEIIATSKGDDAFAARQYRLNGRSVTA